jgi:hypothetical protein
MWRMIKADIAYYRTLFFILYSTLFVAVIINAVRTGFVEILSSLMFISVGMIGIVAGIEEVKTKRVRFFSALPLTVRQLGILRYPVFVAYWLSLMALLYLSSLLSRQGHVSLDHLWWILTRTGSMFIMVACMDLGQDLPFCVKDKGPGLALKWIAILFGIFGGPFVYFATNSRTQSDKIFMALSEFFETSTGAIGLLLFSLGLMVLSIWVYEQRKSYTE